MKNMLYSALCIGLLSSASIAQDQADIAREQVDVKDAQPQVIGVQNHPRLPLTHLRQGRLLLRPQTMVAEGQSGRPIVSFRPAGIVQSSNVKFAGKCSSCHTSTSFSAGEGAMLDYFSITSQEMTSGAALLKPDPVTRSMLKLEGNQGLVVHGVCPTAKRLKSVLEAHDIILSVNGESAEDIRKVDQALGSPKALRMMVLRNGEKKEIKRPSSPDVASTTQQRHYLVGVVLGELYPVVKSQLQLDDSVSVFIKDFSERSAAKKAGLKKNDILLNVNGSPILDSATLQKAVRESAGKALDMEVMRDGSQLHFTVKPRQIEASYVSLVDGKDPLTEGGRFCIHRSSPS